MSEKHKKVCRVFTYFEYFLVFVSAVSGCASISTFTSLVGVPVDIVSSEIRIKINAIIAGMKKYKSIISKNKKKHDKIVLLVKTELNTVKVLLSKALIEPYINYDEFFFSK